MKFTKRNLILIGLLILTKLAYVKEEEEKSADQLIKELASQCYHGYVGVYYRFH